MVGGCLAVTLKAGFLDGILTGFPAFYVALGIARHARLPACTEACHRNE
ncbi:hypothetical protein EC912_102206 [Luteibacter rhizovicinus]|uniref:Uncharacterized protein n=1 Tax=Luteibacter rhizovicinus TaxID=242606 RepID=A0A4R3YTK0_9GAMM|nr:hypothetical protein EC912_102206 [Luteibacter rhizovicinus]